MCLRAAAEEGVTPHTAAGKFCAAQNIPADYAYGAVEPQMARQLARWEHHAEPQEPLIRNIEISVEIGHKTFTDRILWNLADPASSVDGYAITVCRDLKLDWKFCAQIKQAVEDQLLELQMQASRDDTPERMRADSPHASSVLRAGPDEQLGPRLVDRTPAPAPRTMAWLPAPEPSPALAGAAGAAQLLGPPSQPAALAQGPQSVASAPAGPSAAEQGVSQAPKAEVAGGSGWGGWQQLG
eukprot:jgi/Astpho2/1379/fgenesh1_pg.00025_%23_12_t